MLSVEGTGKAIGVCRRPGGRLWGPSHEGTEVTPTPTGSEQSNCILSECYGEDRVLETAVCLTQFLLTRLPSPRTAGLTSAMLGTLTPQEVANPTDQNFPPPRRIGG